MKKHWIDLSLKPAKSVYQILTQRQNLTQYWNSVQVKQDPKISRDSYYGFRNFISFKIHEHHHITSWRRIGIIHWLIFSYRSCFMIHDSYYTGIYLSHLNYYSLNSLRSSWLKPWWWWGHSNGALMRQNGVEKKGRWGKTCFFIKLFYGMFFYFF